ncbi:MAG: aminoacyl-tRNA hydrolase [Candidatus Aminicenantes bacterium]|nr:aminoacyl-tRNA hydrolase [Candidatus Aminicenantes bacterium]
MWALVGLGNPGKQYAETRHNVGFIFVKRIAKAWKIKLRRKIYLCKGEYAEIDSKKVLIALPQTYMNNSGVAVQAILSSGKVKPENLIVVYDDLDIPLGNIRIRDEGRAGSHKGMISIIEQIKTSQFPRIRVGIGPLRNNTETAEYVLSPFNEEEKAELEIALPKAQDALNLILDGQIKQAMNKYNTRSRPETEGIGV